MFQVIGYINNFTTCGHTSHVVKRSKRLQIANMLINSEKAKVCKIALVDKGHEDGCEVHVIFNNGIVKVYNERTRKFITVLICRPSQMERYNIALTKTMRNKIKNHISSGYNQIEF